MGLFSVSLFSCSKERILLCQRDARSASSFWPDASRARPVVGGRLASARRASGRVLAKRRTS